jgi:glycosyltransferase involved in cell wall biosynthesis
MRIGIVTTWFERGAAMVSRAYRDVLRRDHEVFIFARGGEQVGRNDPNWDGPEVTWGRPGTCYTYAARFGELARWARHQALDIVLFNEERFWPTVVLARRELRAAIGAYVDYYTDDTVPLFGLYDFLVCNTRRHYSVFADHPNAVLVPWGTDCETFRGDGAPVSPGEVVFFHSAGISPPRKGTETALRAFALVQGPCRFVLHVQRPVSTWPALAEICGRDARIEVVEKSVHAPGLYHRGDVYVYPTILEGIGLTIAEALACGLPVIVPDSAPMNEFVTPDDGSGGRRVVPESTGSPLTRESPGGRLVTPDEYRGRADGYYWAECYCRPEDVAREMQFYVDRRAELGAFKRAARAWAQERLDWRRNAAGLGAWLEERRGLAAQRRPMPELERRAIESGRLPLARALVARIAAKAGLGDVPAMQRWICG